MNAVHETIRTLSWSRLSTYNQCPRKFFYHYIEQRSHERTSAALVFGSGLHRSFEAINEYRLNSDCEMPLQEALAAFDSAWAMESAGKTIAFGKGEDADSLHQLAERMITAYLSRRSEQPQRNEVVAVEHEANFSLIPDAPSFIARLDLVELSPTGDLIITDYKTSRSPYSEQRIREAWPQLITYCHAAMPLLRELGAKRIVPQLIIITKAKSPKVQYIQPQASQEDVERLKEMASEIWKAIQSENWTPRPSWICKSCSFRDACQRGEQ